MSVLKYYHIEDFIEFDIEYDWTGGHAKPPFDPNKVFPTYLQTFMTSFISYPNCRIRIGATNPVGSSMGAGTGLGHRITSISVDQAQGIEMLLNVQWYDGAGFVHETRNIYWNNYGLGGDTNDCPGDVDGSGIVNVSDLLLVIADWGPCGGCDSDVNEDGTVNVTDLLEIIAAWGPCG